jgi:crotonobetainyl-CoA:carnitine CoA-transferase CaiB-like acyl-CoA transferase
MSDSGERPPILDGVKVVEFAHVIAGPLAGTLLADLGADVVHVENPAGGDTARGQGLKKDGLGLWWKVAGRNKRSVTLDLRRPEGQEVARKLAAWADVVISNFRIGTLESWGLGWSDLNAVNPRLVMLQISANGATSSRRNEPGFGKVGEARSGVLNITGFKDGPPVHAGFSHGDSVTALMGAFGIAAALTRRHDRDFRGEFVDLALFEGLFRLIEWQVIVYDQLGIVPTRNGNQSVVSPAAVANMYRTGDDEWITVTSGTPRAVRQIAAMLGEPLEDLETVDQQYANASRLDEIARAWCAQRSTDEALATMHDAGIVASRIFTMKDIVEDSVYREREDIVSVDDHDFGSVRMQGVIPKMTNHPGKVWRTGPSLGADNELVYRDYLAMSAEDYQRLHDEGII